LEENYYEGMFLLDSGRFASDSEKLSGEIIAMLEKAGGTVIAHRAWQDGKLAYPIARHRKGLHYLAYFRMPGNGLSDVARTCKLNGSVLRHLVIKHPKILFDQMVEALIGPEGGEPSDAARDDANASSTGESTTKAEPTVEAVADSP
jgi:small subunit ribosomal protein S6